MSDGDTLARLVAQAETDGGELITLRAIVEEASDRGAARALEKLGLADEAAHGDVRDLRQLLSSWREVKDSAARAMMGLVAKGLLALILIGLAVRLGIQEMLR